MKRTPYELTLAATAPETPREYRFRTADGVHSKQSFRPAELLLLEHLWDAELGDVLVPAANYGVVGTVLADAADSVQMTESSARAAQLCRANRRANGADADVALLADLADLDRTFDTVAYAPKPYTALPVGKQQVADALSLLSPGGRLYLAGSDRAGLSRYEDALRDLAAPVDAVAGDGDHRLLAATRPRTLDRPSYVSPRRLHPTVDGTELELVAVPGLFSAAGLDDGTRLLLETVDVADGDRVLDLCAGYGPVGAYAGRVADCEVWLTDDDAVAAACADESLRASGVDGTVVTADGTEGVADRTFDRVLCNPPTHAGRGVLSELFAGVADVLAPDGRLDVVHHADLDLGEYLGHVGEVRPRRETPEHAVREVRP